MEGCVLAGPPEGTLARCRIDLPRQLHVSLGQEAGGGPGSAEVGPIAMPASQDREVTTPLASGLAMARDWTPARCCTDPRVSVPMHLRSGPGAGTCFQAASLCLQVLASCTSLAGSYPPLHAGCWESGKCSSFTFQTRRHMGRGEWILGTHLMQHHTTQEGPCSWC